MGGEEGHVLHQNGINLDISQLLKKLAGGLQLVVVDNGIDGYIDLGLELAGVVTQLGNVSNTIAG